MNIYTFPPRKTVSTPRLSLLQPLWGFFTLLAGLSRVHSTCNKQRETKKGSPNTPAKLQGGAQPNPPEWAPLT